jgi:DNA gyrase subunit A
LIEEIEGYELILADHQRVLDIIREDSEEMRARYNSPRRTRIEDTGGEVTIAALIPHMSVALTISHAGYAKRVPMDTYRSQGRGGKGIRASDAKDDDFIEHLFVAETHDDLLCFTDSGRVFKIKVYEVPEMSRTAKGRAMVNLLELREGEKCRAFLPVKDFESGSNFLTFCSRDGIVKRTALKEYRNVNKGGIIAVGLKEGDALLDVTLTGGKDDILLATANGMAIRFNEEDARLMGRAAAGVKGIELEEGDHVIGVIAIPMTDDASGAAEDGRLTKDTSVCLLTICENGYGKRTPLDEYRVATEGGKLRSQSRGGKGRIDIKTSDRNGKAITKGGQLVRLPAGEIRETGRAAQGVRVVSLHEGDSVVAASITPPVEVAEEGTETTG